MKRFIWSVKGKINLLCVCVCVWGREREKERERETVNGPAVELSLRGFGMDLQTHTAAVQLQRASAEHTAHYTITDT